MQLAGALLARPPQGADCPLASRDHQAQGDQGMKTKGNNFCRGSLYAHFASFDPKIPSVGPGFRDPEVYLGIISIGNSVPLVLTDS